MGFPVLVRPSSFMEISLDSQAPRYRVHDKNLENWNCRHWRIGEEKMCQHA
jgi:hypothetical protein